MELTDSLGGYHGLLVQ